MNMTLELNIEGTVSGDGMDIVAAFVGRELRGLGKVQYSPELKKHLVFLTVYSNQAVGETVTFQVWDASACKLYGSTIETFPLSGGWTGRIAVGAPGIAHEQYAVGESAD
jgi:hypothetical protein